MNQDINIFMNYRRLRHLQRCNNFLRISPEDVAQHSYFTTMLAMIIADEYNLAVEAAQKKSDGYSQYEKANVEIVMRKALMHDTDEAITSDIPYNVKHITPEFNAEMEKVLSSMTKETLEGCSELYERYWYLANTCKEGLEGKIVDLADMLELATYCWEEYAAGNTMMKGLLDRAVNYLQTKDTIILGASTTVKGLVKLLSSEPKDQLFRYKL